MEVALSAGQGVLCALPGSGENLVGEGMCIAFLKVNKPIFASSFDGELSFIKLANVHFAEGSLAKNMSDFKVSKSDVRLSRSGIGQSRLILTVKSEIGFSVLPIELMS